MTVGDLKKRLAHMRDDTPLICKKSDGKLVHCVFGVYSVERGESEFYYSCPEFNDENETGIIFSEWKK